MPYKAAPSQSRAHTRPPATIGGPFGLPNEGDQTRWNAIGEVVTWNASVPLPHAA